MSKLATIQQNGQKARLAYSRLRLKLNYGIPACSVVKLKPLTKILKITCTKFLLFETYYVFKSEKDLNTLFFIIYNIIHFCYDVFLFE